MEKFHDGGSKVNMARVSASPLKKSLCYLPWQCLFIANNSVRPESDCLKAVENADKNSLEEIWNGKIMRTYRRNILNNCFDWCNYRCVSGLISEKDLKLP